MNTKPILTLLLLSTAMALPSAGSALSISQNANANALAQELFLGIGGLSVNSSTFSGEATQAGTWTNGTGTYGLPISGIVLSTGNVNDYGASFATGVGNNTTGYNIPATQAQEDLLDPITSVNLGGGGGGGDGEFDGDGGDFGHFDVAQLTIDFDVPAGVEEVSFFGTFGSEEFPEFVGSAFVDGFGLYVNGNNIAEFNGSPVNIDHPDMAAISGTELDGVLAPGGNPVLRFDVPVAEGNNVFDIIIADTSDEILDSTIYLSSFFADGTGSGGGSGGGTGPINTGETEFNPLLPEIDGDGEFVFDPVTGAFDVALPEGLPAFETIWLDPPVSVGFEYESTGGAAFATITAPSLATVTDLDGYMVTVDGIFFAPLAAGATLDMIATFGFAPTSFTLTGINESLMLDPDDPTAFPLGASFDALLTGVNSVTITPITVDSAVVPLPAGAVLYLGALLAGAGAVRLRRKSS